MRRIAHFGMRAIFLWAAAIAIPVLANETHLKPYVLGLEPNTTNMVQAVSGVRQALQSQGFVEAGHYSPYAGATVLVVTNMELKTAAGQARYGGFGAGQRVAITEHKGKLQISYMNPAYIGAAYGLGDLESVSEKLKSALGATQEFGAVDGLTAAALAPGTYHYMVGMPYFHQVDELASFADYETAISTVEQGLKSGKGGTRKVYRIDLPGKQETVFGVAIASGDGIDSGSKDTDREIMEVLDWQELRITASLPYEILVQGGKVLSLRGRYRIALHSPDTKMAGAHGFSRIMSSPSGIKAAFRAVVGGGEQAAK